MNRRLLSMRSNFTKWRNNQDSFFPFKIEIHISRKCNLRCRYCDGGARFHYSKEMGQDTLLRVINECLDLGAREFNFAGAEPTMRKKELIVLLRLIKGRKRKTMVSTNGTFFRREDIKQIVKIRCDEIFISLDSHISSVHNYLRNSTTAFQRTVETLRIIRKLKSKSNDRPCITLVSVLTNLNYLNLPDFVEYVKDFGISQIIFQPLIIQTKEAKKLKLNQFQMKAFTSKIDNLHMILKKYKITSNIDDLKESKYFEKSTNSFEIMLNNSKNPENNLNYDIPCFDPWFSIGILHNGYIGPCINIAESYKVGIKDKSIKKIWYGNYFNNLRRMLFKKDYPQSCIHCKVCTNRLVEIKKAKSSNFCSKN